MYKQTKYRTETEEWVNKLFKFGNAVHLCIHYSDYLQPDKQWTNDELVKVNKRFFRRLENSVGISGGRNRLKRFVVIEGKNWGSKHTHMVIEVPKNREEQRFVMDIHNAVFLTKGMRNDYTDEVWEQRGLVNYLTKQSNKTIDNIDVQNSRY